MLDLIKKNINLKSGIILLAFALFFSFVTNSFKKNKSKDISDFVVLVEKGILTDSINTSGEVKAIRTSNIGPRKQGIIQEINVAEGDLVEKAHKYGVERLLLELLPVVDNLEHALKNLSKDVSDSDKEGIELTLKSFESALDKFGISPIYPISEDFDPIQHEAVSVVKDEKHSDNKIVEVMQKGWRLHERVIRPARVVVIKN